MGIWVKHTEDKRMPVWLIRALKPICTCGTVKENYYNDKGRCTKRRCPNKECPWTIAEKIAAMCSLLGVKGIGNKISLGYVNEYKLKSHLDAVPYLFREKPEVTLPMLMRLLFIEGIDTMWQSVCDRYSSVEEFLDNYEGGYYDVIRDKEEEIRYASMIFKVKDHKRSNCEALLTGTVMISGNIRRFDEREDFIKGINYISRGLVNISVAQSKRKTGVICLIQEKDTPYRGKAEFALENQIPIMSPDEFEQYVLKRLREGQG